MPHELIEHQYRKLFGLSYQELLSEPADLVYLSLSIERKLLDKQQAENKWQ